MPSHKKEVNNGAVYTPPFMANYVADLLVRYYLRYSNSNSSARTTLHAIDPAAGDGELLDSLIRRLSAKSAHKIGKKAVHLTGLDIDKSAITRSKRRFMSLETDRTLLKFRPQFFAVNALFPYKRTRKDGWVALKGKLNSKREFDFVIANPPWGADVESYRTLLARGEFGLATGQYDTSDLFLELSSFILKDGGLFAFIIPDSIFNFERHALRKYLLDSYDLLFIGRLGEGIFPNVNRGCAVIVARKGKSKRTIYTDCFRLSARDRNLVVEGKKSLEKVTQETLHKVPQKRFAKNRNYEFDIDSRADDRAVLDKFFRSNKIFADYLTSSRGVELSKNGRVCRCESCGLWMPMPKNKISFCRHCNAQVNIDQIESKGIVVSHEMIGYQPIIVGENISRYKIETNHWISTMEQGIKYKQADLYTGPKIVVRKTGVGITASIDYANQLTNQVVYILKQKIKEKTVPPLEYFLALLNSRAMYYFNILHSGETEWRSHPYITQQQLLSLPVPQPSAVKSRLVSRIAKLAKPHLESGSSLPSEVDAEVENCLAQLFGLTKSDYKKIYDKLDILQSLIPVRSLKNIGVSDIFS